MRKVLFTYDYPPSNGGISRLCEAISAGLGEKDLVITLDLGKSNVLKSKKAQHIYIPRVSRPMLEYKTIQILRKYLKPDDVLITDVWYLESFLALFANVNKRVVLAHGAELFTGVGFFREQFWGRFMRYTLSKSDLIIANSEYTKKLAQSILPKHRIQAIPLGVDEARFTSKEIYKKSFTNQGKFVIGSISRVELFKGYETVFEAILKLPEELKNKIIYKIAGKGPDLKYLQRKVKEKGLTDQVEFVGFISEEELPSFYQTLDTFILMTEERKESREVEGFGLVFLEAQSCGIPVIGANAGGIPDAISDKNGGWLITSKDSDSLSLKLGELIKSPYLVEQSGKLARKRIVKESTWTIYTEKFHQIIES